MKKTILTILKLGFFLGLGILFIWMFVSQLSSKEKQEIMASFVRANYWWLIPVFIVWLFSHLFRSLRWNLMLDPLGFKPKIHNTFMAVMIGYFANLALPRLGEVSRCSILTKYENIPFTKSFGTVVTERIFDFLIFILLFFIILILQFERIHNYVEVKVYKPMAEKFNMENLSIHFFLLVVLLIILIFVFYFLFRKKLAKWKLYIKIIEQILHFLIGLKSIFLLKKPFLFFLYSALIWLCYLLTTWFCFSCFNETETLSLSPAFTVLVFGSVGYIVVQGGIGLYPVIVVETLTLYGINSSTGYALGWLSWSAQTIMFIVIGIVSILILPLINKKRV